MDTIFGIPAGDFFSQLLGIVLVDLVLGGDNAIVIGMACRNLPDRVRMKGVVLGTVGAVAFRGGITIAIVWLLQIPYLRLVGGLLLIVIGIKLMVKQDEEKEVKAADSLRNAVFTVIAADAIMGIDNVLAVAGVADGHFGMVLIGLCISVPIVVFGSTLVMKLMNRFPFIIYIGAAVILYTAGKMITEEPAFGGYFETRALLHWLLVGGVTAAGLIIGAALNRKAAAKTAKPAVEPGQELDS
ncbi:MAG: TerC family protein [Clostridiales Family XIII bacterium]|jgi:YjbE family integral membrane protein|nr:TerC family protein [Clostridiales Family XIII bacterium]